jgi:hypothetical protein
LNSCAAAAPAASERMQAKRMLVVFMGSLHG